MADPYEQIATYIANYRAAMGDPSTMMREVLGAYPGATMADYVCGLGLANRATIRTAASLRRVPRFGGAV